MSQVDISAMKTRLYQWKLHLKLVVCNIGRTEKASSIFLHATNNPYIIKEQAFWGGACVCHG
jgi:hypothetical protein